MKIPWFNKKEKQQPFEAELKSNEVEPKIDFNSPTWRYIERKLNKSLSEARESNDNPNHDETKTANTRGKIRAYKDLLALNKGAGKATAGILNATESW